MAFFQTPWRAGYWPVKMLPRAGAQTGWLQKALRKRTPWLAMRSRLGVRFMGLRRMAPTQSQRNWSERMRTMLGRAAGGCGAWEARAAAGMEECNGGGVEGMGTH